MKIVRINESQKHRLFEAYRDGFSLNKLSLIGELSDDGSNFEMARYCNKWLGRPFAMGSSRLVYSLSDSLVLKLAYGNTLNSADAGRRQNQVEWDLFNSVDSPLLTRIFTHDEGFNFMVCEHVLPADEVDFEKLLGIPFFLQYVQNSRKMSDHFSNGGDTEVGYNSYFDGLKDRSEVPSMTMNRIMSYMEANYVTGDEMYDKETEDVINGNKWLTELRRLVANGKIGDLSHPSNFGLVNRDGHPMLVVLDYGMDLDVYSDYYGKG